MQQPKKMKKKELVMHIYNKYLQDDSTFQLNVPTTLLENLRETIKQNKLTAQIFVDIENHIFEILRSDIWPRFTRSKEFKNFKLKITA